MNSEDKNVKETNNEKLDNLFIVTLKDGELYLTGNDPFLFSLTMVIVMNSAYD